MKKFFFILIASLLSIASFAQTPLAVGDKFINNGVKYAVTGVNPVTLGIVSFDNEAEGSYSGHVVIPGSFTYNDEQCTVISFIEQPFKGTSIESLEINTSTIPNSAFSGLESLKSLTIGDNVQSIKAGAFTECSALETVTFGANLTSIGAQAFSGTAITSIVIPDKVTTIDGYAFYNCYNLKDVKVNCPQLFNFEAIVFNGCSAIENLELDFSCAIPSGAFSGKTSLKSLKIGDNVTAVGDGSFSGCSSLATLSLGKSVKTIGNSAFSGTAITSVQLPSSMETIGSNAFGSTLLTSIEVPSTVTSIGSSAFSNCSLLKDVKVDCPQMTSFNYVFGGSKAIENLELNVACDISSGMFSNYANLKKVTLGDNVTGVGSGAFYYCSSLTSLSLGSSIKTIGSSAFYGTAITSIELPSSLESIGGIAFNGTQLTSIVIPESVKSIDASAFYCDVLKSVTILGKDTEFHSSAFGRNIESLNINCSTIPDNAFANYFQLKDVTIGNNVKTIGNTTFVRTPITSITLGNSVESIGSSAFAGTGLTSINIPASVTSIDLASFSDCIDLSTITVDASNASFKVVDNVLYSKDGKTLVCYPDNNELKEYTMPESVEEVDYDAFNGSVNLEKININAKVEIGEFSGCENLSEINVASGNPYIYSLDGVLFYNDGSLLSYPPSKNVSAYTIPATTVSVEQYAFYGAKYLEEITIPEDVYDPEFLKPIPNLKKVNIEGAGDNVKVVDGVIYSADMKQLLFYPSGKSDATFTIPQGVEVIDDYAFGAYSEYKSLKELELPASLTAFDGRAFWKCPNLESIKINENNTSFKSENGAIYDISDANHLELLFFVGDESMTSFEIPSDTKYIETSAFDNAKYLEEVKVPLSISSALGSLSLFQGMPSLKRVDIDEADPKFKSVDDVIYYSEGSNYEIVLYPAGKTDTTFEISEDVTGYDNNAFFNCNNIKEIITHNSSLPITYDILDFLENLSSVTFDYSEVGPYALKSSSNESIKSITFTDKVTKLYYDAINAYLKGLESIIMESVTPPAIDGSNPFPSISKDQIVIYVPNEAVDAYKADAFWGKYNIQSIDDKPTAIAPVVTDLEADEIISTEVYSLTGARLSAPQKGINIIRNIYKSGRIETQKSLKR